MISKISPEDEDKTDKTFFILIILRQKNPSCLNLINKTDYEQACA